MSFFYDRHGQPITLQEWGAKLRDNSYRQVAESIGSGYRVSTVWLGIDHSFGDRPPLIFETMIFEQELTHSELTGEAYHKSLDFQRRYSTEAEALEGHRVVVEWFKGQLATRQIASRQLEPP